MSLTIGTLRLRSAAPDSAALRLGATRSLQGADLEPAGLSPSAVLVVRRVADPLPGRFTGGRPRPGAEWESAVRGRLGAAARTAARPDGTGRLSSAAEAVLFADEAELLACLLVDRVRGELPARWWWRPVLRRLGISAFALDGDVDPAPFLKARPRQVPGALAVLARWGRASPVVHRLAARDAASILELVALEYALPQALIGPSMGRTAAGGPAVSPDGSPGSAIGSGGRVVGSGPPWADWLPAELIDRSLSAEVHCLLGLGIGLATASARVRSRAVVGAAERWWAAQSARSIGHGPAERIPGIAAGGSEGVRRRPGAPGGTGGTRPHPPQHRSAAVRRRVDGGPRRTRRPGRIFPADPGAGTGSKRTSPGADRGEVGSNIPDPAPEVLTRGGAASRRDPAEGGQPFAPSAPTAGSGVSPGERALPAGAAGANRGADARPGAPPDDTAGPVVPAAPADPGTGEVTRLGGVLYLIHALEELGLPDAFEPGWRLASSAGAWGTLDLIARALLGPRLERVADDPLWDALAELRGADDGRSRRGGRRPDLTPAGGRWDPSFRVPTEWPQRVADDPDRIRWAERAGRIWVWSRCGYLLTHRRFEGDARAAARRSAGAYGPESDRARPVRAPRSAIPWLAPAELPEWCPPRLGRWAAAVTPLVRHRLLLALDDASTGSRTPGCSRQGDPIPSLLLVGGRLHVTCSHVDLVAEADQADLAVRRAGLDRDPGWLPAYGRVVYFHFS